MMFGEQFQEFGRAAVAAAVPARRWEACALSRRALLWPKGAPT